MKSNKRFFPPGLSLLLIVAFFFVVLLLLAIATLGVISLVELSTVNSAWRLFAATGIGSAIALLVATRFAKLPQPPEAED